MDTMHTDHPGSEWWNLREIVLEAASGRLSPLVEAYRDNPVAVAAVAYLNDRRQEAALNSAAKSLAAMKIGADPVAIANNYWLVLEKS